MFNRIAVVLIGCVAASSGFRNAVSVFPAGRVEARTIYDSVYKRDRRIWIYTPPGYDARRPQPYPLVIAFDGEDYRDTMPLPRVLDSLLAAHKAPAFVALLVDNSNGAVRIADLGNSEKMSELIGRQLIPYTRNHWHVTTDPHRVIITGSSAGGLASAFIAFRRPDLIANVWSQSGAFWRGAEGSNGAPFEWLTAQVKSNPKRDVSFVLDVGALETRGALGGSGPSILDANRRFRDALKAKGYAVTYSEIPGGQHSPVWWRLRLPVGIESLSTRWR